MSDIYGFKDVAAAYGGYRVVVKNGLNVSALELLEEIQKLQAENAELKKQSQWISVDDELPPLLQTVEVWLVGEQCYERAWRSEWSDGEITWIFSNQAYEDRTSEITHWKSLSTPPEGE